MLFYLYLHSGGHLAPSHHVQKHLLVLLNGSLFGTAMGPGRVITLVLHAVQPCSSGLCNLHLRKSHVIHVIQRMLPR